MFADFLAVCALLILVALGLGHVGVLDLHMLCHAIAQALEALAAQ